jgi:hypothetical protein
MTCFRKNGKTAFVLLLRIVFLCALTLPMAAATSCGPATQVIRWYPGPLRPRTELALLGFYWSGRENLLLIDNRRIPIRKATRFQIELLPGVHEIEGVQPYNLSMRVPKVRFVAEASKTYGLTFQPSARSVNRDFFVVEVYEEDPASGRVFRLVSSPSSTEP